jgi:hypothetical protein
MKTKKRRVGRQSDGEAFACDSVSMCEIHIEADIDTHIETESHANASPSLCLFQQRDARRKLTVIGQ